jgi:hypothetical protein
VGSTCQGEKKTKGYRFGFFSGLRAEAGWAGSGAGLEGFPRGPFHIFISLLLFLFLFPYLLHKFCILNPNQVKPNS